MTRRTAQHGIALCAAVMLLLAMASASGGPASACVAAGFGSPSGLASNADERLSAPDDDRAFTAGPVDRVDLDREMEADVEDELTLGLPIAPPSCERLPSPRSWNIRVTVRSVVASASRPMRC